MGGAESGNWGKASRGGLQLQEGHTFTQPGRVHIYTSQKGVIAVCHTSLFPPFPEQTPPKVQLVHFRMGFGEESGEKKKSVG